MKFKVFSSCFLVLTFNLVFGNDIFFSEYIEGSSYNKAIEIYNPTGSAVDLSHYVVKQANNGSGWGSYTPTGGVPTEDTRYVLPLSGTLNAGDVYVIYHTSAVTAISSVGDLGFAYNGTVNGGDGDNVVNFNGNDALGLFKDGVLIDVIGVPTENPGDNKGWAVAGTSNGTYDHTIVRKSSITQGNTDWTASAGTSANDSEWIVNSKDTFTNLGVHVSDTGPNVAPIANAGVDRVVDFGTLVTLDGSESNDPDGSIVSYAWTQVMGTTVTLSATDQAVVSFTTPDVIAELAFELVVTDDSSAIGKDTVNILVNPSPIIISEYVEGSSYNKYLEIYNGSDAPVSLSEAGYSLRLSSNGSNNFWAIM
ncbi:MAG: lamin tail domain-containing protein, partial [Candidatus Marinimicrobia bacterium]|nr:lamin tail domain-containing protein [bacterium]MCG2715857.1 lamin tail domain-containing protein [Candidatus Neomarinimicrobiota bacterium]